MDFKTRRRMLMGSSKKELISPLYIYEPGYTEWDNVIENTYTGSSSPTVTFQNDSVKIGTITSTTPRKSVLLKVDFTGYNKLSITHVSTGSNMGPYVGYCNVSDVNSFVERDTTSFSSKTSEFDISELEGEYYIKLQSATSYVLTVNEIKLEI